MLAHLPIEGDMNETPILIEQAVKLALTTPELVLGQRLRIYFDHEVNLIATSSYGRVFSLQYGGFYPMIMKVPRGQIGASSLHHEGLVGGYLNQLRPLVPNFMYVYGLTTGANPLVLDDQIIPFILNGDNSTIPKLFTELIAQPSRTISATESASESEAESEAETASESEAGYTLEQYIRDGLCSPEQYANFILGICYALEIAQERFKFTHYDLHPGNIVIRSLAIPHTYQINGRSITTDRIPVMIDYGLSHITIEGVEYGTDRPVKVGNNVDARNEYNSMEDIFRLLYRTRSIVTSGPINQMVKSILTKIGINETNIRFQYYGPDILRSPAASTIEGFRNIIRLIEAEWLSDWIPSSTPAPDVAPAPAPVRSQPDSIPINPHQLVPSPLTLAVSNPSTIELVTDAITVLESLTVTTLNDPNATLYYRTFFQAYYLVNRELTTTMLWNDRPAHYKLSAIKSQLREVARSTLLRLDEYFHLDEEEREAYDYLLPEDLEESYNDIHDLVSQITT